MKSKSQKTYGLYKTQRVYCLWEIHGSTSVMAVLMDIFSSLGEADRARRYLESLRSKKDKPKYDDWGLVDGIEYFVSERELL